MVGFQWLVPASSGVFKASTRAIFEDDTRNWQPKGDRKVQLESLRENWENWENYNIFFRENWEIIKIKRLDRYLVPLNPGGFEIGSFSPG